MATKKTPNIVKQRVWEGRVIENSALVVIRDDNNEILDIKVGDGVKTFGELPSLRLVPKPPTQAPGTPVKALISNGTSVSWGESNNSFPYGVLVFGDGTKTEFEVYPIEDLGLPFAGLNAFVVTAESNINHWGRSYFDFDLNKQRFFINFSDPVPNGIGVWCSIIVFSAARTSPL